MVDGEDQIQTLPPGEMNECSVRKVHRPIGIAFHQGLQIGQVAIIDWKNRDRARAQESPGSGQTTPIVAEQMEYFTENGSRRRQRQSKLHERGRATTMPSIVAIEKREDRPGVDQPVSGHGAP